MSVTAVTLCILATTTTVGALWSVAIIRRGIPENAIIPGMDRQFKTFRKRIPLTCINLTILFLGTAIAMPFCEPAFDMTFPAIWLLLVQAAIIFLADDAFFYWWHRLLHENKYLYRKIHKIHHRAFTPLPIDYIHAHPVEWTVGALGPISGVFLITLTFGSINAWALWLFVIFRQVHELNIHSGYKSVILHKLFPISPAEHHDMHHAKPHSGNYGSLLCYWDRLFNTQCPIESLKQN